MLVDKVEAALHRHDMVRRGDTLVVAVSGGPDSLSLLDALHQIAPRLALHLLVAHLDHGLRAESPADAQFVASLARQLGLPAKIRRVEIADLARSRRTGIEEAARESRHAFLGEVAAEVGAAGVALGHTLDDQVETIVLAIVRGAGPDGLRGMSAVTQLTLPKPSPPLRLLRPLLEVSRAEVEQHLAARGLEPRRDPSNQDESFLRNRVRHGILPALRTANPRVDEAVLRLSRQAAADAAYFDARIAEVWDSIAEQDEQSVQISRSDALRLPPSLASRVMRRAYASLRGDARELSAAHVEAALNLLRRGVTGARADWPSGIRVTLGYERLVVSTGEPREPRRDLGDDEIPLATPGATTLPTGARIVARLTAVPCRWEDRDQCHVDLDFARTGQRLVVRRRRPGDRITPLGMRGEKRLQDLLVDARVPRAERDAVPVLEGGHGIVWVAGVRADERYRASDETREILCLRLGTACQSGAREG